MRPSTQVRWGGSNRDRRGTEDTITVVSLASTPSRADLLEVLSADAVAAGRDPIAALELASAWGHRLPRPGTGQTTVLWEALATVAAADLQVARALEPHLDAAAILHELHGGDLPEASTWGVFAAEGPGARLTAEPAHQGEPTDAWVLDGVKPWCSLAGELSHALVTAWAGPERRLFAVGLRHPGVRLTDQAWVAHGLPGIRSTSVAMDQVPATPVGEPRWYLERDGFSWGGIGVAAIWYGAAVRLFGTLVERSGSGSRPADQVAQMHVGAADLSLHAARTVLADAAREVDSGRASGRAGVLLAQRARGAVAAAAEDLLSRIDHALGPAPLATDAAHAARVADLHLYLRQHHAERDQAALGRLLLETTT